MRKPARIRVACAASLVLSGGCLEQQSYAAPRPPLVAAAASPTSRTHLHVRGVKQASTAIDVNGTPAVPLDEDTAFSVDVALHEGPNVFDFVAVDALGARSASASLFVARDTTAPTSLVLDPMLPRSLAATVRLRGDIDAGAALYIDGVLVDDDGDARFSVEQAIAVGINRFALAALDEVGNEGPRLQASIERVDRSAFPFSLDEPTPQTTSDTIELGGACELDVVVRVDDDPPLPCTDGRWAVSRGLFIGDNPFRIAAAFAGELDVENIERNVTITRIATARAQGGPR